MFPDFEDLLRGVQFHPESIATPDGATMLANFLVSCGEICGSAAAAVALVGDNGRRSADGE